MSQETDIKTWVLDKVAHGEVPMRSRSYFTLKVVATFVLAALSLVLAALVLSFVVFSIHESGEQFLLGFGTQGVVVFIRLFPWGLFVFALAAVAVLELLLRTFRFGYRLPLVRIFLSVLVVASVATAFVSTTPLHAFLRDEAEQNKLPIVGHFYEEIYDSHVPEGVYRGTISSFASGGFIMTHDDGDHDSDDGTWVVIPPAGLSTSTLRVGDEVYVAGYPENGAVHAYGVHSLESQDD